MAKYKVTINGVNTSKLKPMKNKETIELLEEYKNGNEDAQNKIVEGNLKLILSVVQKYGSRYDNMDDLFQIGVIGLIKAINNFSTDHQVRFSTYAVPMIDGEIKRFLRDNTPLRISRQIKDLAYQALKMKEKYINEYSKEITEIELGQELNCSTYKIKEALDSILSISSLFEPNYNEVGDAVYLIDQIKDEDNNYQKLSNLLTLSKGISTLDDIQKNIIKKRYYDDNTQSEIAQEFGISQAQVSRLEKSAIEVLKKYF